VLTSKVQRALAVVLAGLVAAIAVVLITGVGGDSRNASRAAGVAVIHKANTFYGPSMPSHLRAANFTLTDQDGTPITLDHERGHVVVLTFIHSLCKDACPFMTEQIKGALNLLPGRGRGVATIGVSVEHRQDTVAHRDQFLRQHDMMRRMWFLNGSPAALKHVYDAYGINPVHGKVDHSTFVLLIDKRGFERVGYAADQLTPGHLAHDIRLLQRQAA
jgi:cytochrome oxidase Cu insertion factor (SCO1/SenC/PrrC family)